MFTCSFCLQQLVLLFPRRCRRLLPASWWWSTPMIGSSITITFLYVSSVGNGSHFTPFSFAGGTRFLRTSRREGGGWARGTEGQRPCQESSETKHSAQAAAGLQDRHNRQSMTFVVCSACWFWRQWTLTWRHGSHADDVVMASSWLRHGLVMASSWPRLWRSERTSSSYFFLHRKNLDFSIRPQCLARLQP